MDPAEPITLGLLRRWQGGDEDALAALVERHRAPVRERVEQRLGALLRSREETDDIVQEVLLQFLRDGPRIRIADDTHLRMLLARIVENVIRDKHGWYTARRREAARERPLPSGTVLVLDGGAVETPSKLVDKQEREAWVRLGLELLEPDDRRVIILRQWDDASFGAIAAELGVAEDAARMRYQRALGRLSRKIGALRRGKIETALAASENEG